jgi:hypothetical protein
MEQAMRKHGRTDANQPAIVKALRLAGASVAITSEMGGGFPDLVVAKHGITFMVEVKDPTAAKADRQLTPNQKNFHESWRGKIFVVETVEEALQILAANT